jgi:hypothetical protein
VTEIRPLTEGEQIRLLAEAVEDLTTSMWFAGHLTDVARDSILKMLDEARHGYARVG